MNYENDFKVPPTAPPPYSSKATDSYPSAPAYGFSVPQPTQVNPPYTTQPQSVIQPTPIVNHQTVVVLGGCPSCRVGRVSKSYTCCGICCAIVFFPVGILCCLCMKENRCENCGATF